MAPYSKAKQIMWGNEAPMPENIDVDSGTTNMVSEICQTPQMSH
jgi:hypothetical protein